MISMFEERRSCDQVGELLERACKFLLARMSDNVQWCALDEEVIAKLPAFDSVDAGIFLKICLKRQLRPSDHCLDLLLKRVANKKTSAQFSVNAAIVALHASHQFKFPARAVSSLFQQADRLAENFSVADSVRLLFACTLHKQISLATKLRERLCDSLRDESQIWTARDVHSFVASLTKLKIFNQNSAVAVDFRMNFRASEIFLSELSLDELSHLLHGFSRVPQPHDFGNFFEKLSDEISLAENWSPTNFALVLSSLARAQVKPEILMDRCESEFSGIEKFLDDREFSQVMHALVKLKMVDAEIFEKVTARCKVIFLNMNMQSAALCFWAAAKSGKEVDFIFDAMRDRVLGEEISVTDAVRISISGKIEKIGKDATEVILNRLAESVIPIEDMANVAAGIDKFPGPAKVIISRFLGSKQPSVPSCLKIAEAAIACNCGEDEIRNFLNLHNFTEISKTEATRLASVAARLGDPLLDVALKVINTS